eukprot:UN01486
MLQNLLNAKISQVTISMLLYSTIFGDFIFKHYAAVDSEIYLHFKFICEKWFYQTWKTKTGHILCETR